MAVAERIERRAVTLREVAEASGVSISTVSRILDDRIPQSRSSTAERVRQTADALGYRRNAAASGLRRGATGTIGVLVPRLTDTVMALMFEAVERAARTRGYFAVVATSGDEPDDERRATETLLDRGVDAVILATARLGDLLPASLRDRGIPHVLVLRSDGVSPSSLGDDEMGGYLAVRHLVDLGHRDIAVVTGPGLHLERASSPRRCAPGDDRGGMGAALRTGHRRRIRSRRRRRGRRGAVPARRCARRRSSPPTTTSRSVCSRRRTPRDWRSETTSPSSATTTSRSRAGCPCHSPRSGCRSIRSQRRRSNCCNPHGGRRCGAEGAADPHPPRIHPTASQFSRTSLFLDLSRTPAKIARRSDRRASSTRAGRIPSTRIPDKTGSAGLEVPRTYHRA